MYFLKVINLLPSFGFPHSLTHCDHDDDDDNMECALSERSEQTVGVTVEVSV